MEELFPQALTILTQTSTNLDQRLKAIFSYGDKVTLTDEQWTEYGDALENLHGHLRTVDSIINTNYVFSGDLPADIIGYTAELTEHKEPIGEVIGYYLSQLDSADNFSGHRPYYSKESLDGIISNCHIINGFIGRQG